MLRHGEQELLNGRQYGRVQDWGHYWAPWPAPYWLYAGSTSGLSAFKPQTMSLRSITVVTTVCTAAAYHASRGRKNLVTLPRVAANAHARNLLSSISEETG